MAIKFHLLYLGGKVPSHQGNMQHPLKPLSGWRKLILTGNIRTDIGITFIADKPYPTSILKIFAKAKVLAGYKE